MRNVVGGIALAASAMVFTGCVGTVSGGGDSAVAADADVADAGDDSATADSGTTDMCDALRTLYVYNGHVEPELGRPGGGLRPGQVSAVGQMGGGCSGTLITKRWVLTATHCGIQVGDEFCIGIDFDNPNVCIQVAQVESTGTDLTIARLDRDAASELPGVEPVPINTEALGARIGEQVETAGLGSNNIPGTPSFGVRYFATEYLNSVSDDMLSVDGRGEQGVCGGDSGGPVFVIATDSTIRVAGDLYGGDPSCVDVDNYTRTDAHVDFIVGFAGEEATTPVGDGCGSITAEGMCRDAQTALYCDGDQVRTDVCPDDQHCDFDAAAGGYRCVAGPDPCARVARRPQAVSDALSGP